MIIYVQNVNYHFYLGNGNIMKKHIEEYIKINNDLSRANSQDYIKLIFDSFIEFSGDRLAGDDVAIIGGIARLNKQFVTVIAQRRGKTIQDNILYNYSMCSPQGYRKSLRLMKQAEKFNRPIICLVDTIGAYPGEEAEKHGQAIAISQNLMEMMYIKVPIISILIGNGGSGGALALCVANEIAILENALLSVISPKACANILWKDSSREHEAAQLLKMTSYDLKDYEIVETIIPEQSLEITSNLMKDYIVRQLSKYKKVSSRKLVKLRYRKYRYIDKIYLKCNQSN